VTVERVSGGLSWGWGGHNLIRYNRVEGLALGGRFESDLASPRGPLSFQALGFLGLADLEPKVRLSLERQSLTRRIALGAYRELQPTHRRGRHMGFGSSLNALLLGRDYGEYYLATGADLLWRSPATSRQAFELRVYGERQDPLETKTDFSLLHAFDGDWEFRPNVAGDGADEVGAELHLAPWWGTDPLQPQVGLELYGHGAAWRAPDSTVTGEYFRASAMVRVALPLGSRSWRVGLEAGAGTTWGSAPSQRRWFVGGPRSLRGYDAGTLSGSSFTRGRLEVARAFSVWGVSAFGDVAWAGPADELDSANLLYGLGLGASFMDGLFRVDICRGLTDPHQDFRVEFYLDAVL
ncbi:hypothetical protein ACFL3Z_02055, partial [Gemmatimonadota bacterium]